MTNRRLRRARTPKQQGETMKASEVDIAPVLGGNRQRVERGAKVGTWDGMAA